jgi:hypothetical protein
MPLIRRVGNLGLSFLCKLASGHWGLLDPTNGYVAIRADVLRCLKLNALSDGYFFELSMLIELGKWGFKVVEFPMESRYQGERSSLSIPHALWTFPFRLLLGTAARIWYRHFWYDFTLAALLLLTGVPLFSWGLCFGLYAWWQSITTHSAATAGTVMLSALPLLVGVNCLLQAISFEVSGDFNARVSVNPVTPIGSSR